MDRIKHLYVHIPFCPHVCPYCSFHVLPVHKGQMGAMVDFLIKEHKLIAHELELETIFFGGGTPTALSTDTLGKLLPILIPKISLEVSMECNPSTLSVQKAEILIKHGVNRLSIGAQSFDPVVLKTLGRTHSADAIRQCLKNARIGGFKNIGLDLIFGVPGQTLDSWRKTLEMAVELQPQHISCYGLTYEEDTDFFLRHQKGELKSNDPLEHEMFDLADEILIRSGLGHYEISNYALPGYESRHNLAYWRGADFHGIGPSAVGTVRGVRRRNGKLENGKWSVENEEPLSVDTLASERMALGLRTQEGIQEDIFSSRFGFSPMKRWDQEIKTLVQQGLMETKPNLHLTRRGREIADEVATYFV